jgi:hypothetical protein
MNYPASRREWRVLVHRDDGGAELVAALREGGVPPDVLQLVGDPLLRANVAGISDAAASVQECAIALRARDWSGDRELAAELDAVLGAAARPGLQPLPVHLDELAELLEGDPTEGGGYIDLENGEVWPQSAIDYAVEVGDVDEDDLERSERWLPVEREGSRSGYRDMEDFIETVTDPRRISALVRAIDGRAPFRRFKDALAGWPGELDRWLAFSEERRLGRARAYLAEAGYTPSVAPPRAAR